MDTLESCRLADGVLVVHKEAGWTSHDVVAKVRQALGGMKVGHAGTLDPSATGVLPLLIGKGTRIAEYLVAWDKEYRAVLRLGETTDTQDAAGTIQARSETEGVTQAAIEAAAACFRGTILQVPPMFSAVKVAGVPLYKSARAGKTVAREPRAVVIHALEVLGMDGRDVTLRVVCSKGTYVRTLCADIGRVVGVGGHLLSLERRRVGSLVLDQALTVDEITVRQALGTLARDVIPLETVMKHIPAVVVDGRVAARVAHGAPVALSQVVQGDHREPASGNQDRLVRIHEVSGRLLALGTYPREPEGMITVDKVFVEQQ